MDKPVITKIDFAYNLESKDFYKLEIELEWLPEFAHKVKDAFMTLETLLNDSFPHCKKKAVGDINGSVAADIVEAGYEYISKHGTPCTLSYMCMKRDWGDGLKLNTSINLKFHFSEKHAAKIWEIYEFLVSNYKVASWVPKKLIKLHICGQEKADFPREVFYSGKISIFCR